MDRSIHRSIVGGSSPPPQSVLSSAPNALLPHQAAPQIHCTNDMCPIRLHWHVKQNYKSYWRVKLTISNRNYAWNYSQWNVVVQHPNFHNLSEVFSFTYKSLNPYGSAISKASSLPAVSLSLCVCVVCDKELDMVMVIDLGFFLFACVLALGAGHGAG
jgi:hypothetical protein